MGQEQSTQGEDTEPLEVDISGQSPTSNFVLELHKLQPMTDGVRLMIVEAESGEYSEETTTKYIDPKAAAVSGLMAMGHMALAKRVEDGEFDDVG